MILHMKKLYGKKGYVIWKLAQRWPVYAQSRVEPDCLLVKKVAFHEVKN